MGCWAPHMQGPGKGRREGLARRLVLNGGCSRGKKKKNRSDVGISQDQVQAQRSSHRHAHLLEADT